MAHQRVSLPLPQEVTERPRSSRAPTIALEVVRSKDGALYHVSGSRGLHSSFSSADYEILLGRVAHRAMALTRASAAAIGLRQPQVVVCRARCGELSPPLGARVNPDFGISGECLRTGNALSCADSETDARVDVRACRELGIRSIAAVPVSGDANVDGILEVFSGKPNAFGDSQLKILAVLADLVAAISREANQATVRPPAAPSGEARREAAETLSFQLTVPPRKSTPGLAIRRFSSPGSYSLAAAGVSLLVCMVALVVPSPKGVRGVVPTPAGERRPPSRTVPGKPASRHARRQPDPTNFDLPLHAGGLSGADSRSSPDLASQSPRETLSNDDATSPRHASIDPVVVTPGAAIARPASSSARRDRPLAVVPPATKIGSTVLADPTLLEAMVSHRTRLPQLGFSVFQGISGGSVERTVEPTYPPKALTLRRQGSVLLHALIDLDGSVRQLKAVSGDPILVPAAIEAITQWRYQPYLLNGHPITRETELTQTFKLP